MAQSELTAVFQMELLHSGVQGLKVRASTRLAGESSESQTRSSPRTPTLRLRCRVWWPRISIKIITANLITLGRTLGESTMMVKKTIRLTSKEEFSTQAHLQTSIKPHLRPPKGAFRTPKTRSAPHQATFWVEGSVSRQG